MPINCTHEVNRLAAQMMDEGEPNEDIEQAVNEYLMDCDMEHPEVLAALFYDRDDDPTLTDFALMTTSERKRCHSSWTARRLDITTDFYTLTA